MNRPLPAPYRDVALLVARVLLGVVMFAHGYQKMIINGIGRTTEGFESLSIPLAIMSASFVTMVEFAGSALLILGALTPFVSACNLVIMGGAAFFVHAKNGIFVADGGWELVGVIGAGFLMLAACGPGRFSVDHLVANRQRADREALARAQSSRTAPEPQYVAERPAYAPAAYAPAPYAPAPAVRRVEPAPADLWTPPGGLTGGTPLPRRGARLHAAPTDAPTGR
ncbi:DoxX family protein [Pseudonocardia broussonetiae]|uniref:DoxX family protein n=1 Tax=Pseudonocardia broussonetiae TaxID=2736640 RepID=UPI001966CAEE|nr:DoxX family protein [Pseudonocardia broussonetiae]